MAKLAVAQCVDCHMPKTARTGSGQPSGLVGDAPTSRVYWWNDVSSHRFDVPRKADSVATGGMPTGYTNPCGACHSGTGM